MADMANDDKPDTEASAEPKEPKSQPGASEEQPKANREDATAPKVELEPTKQDEGDADHAAPAEVSTPAAAAAAAADEDDGHGHGHGEDHGHGHGEDHGHGHGEDHGHGHGEDHGLAHTMPIWMLVAVLGALMLLTVLTVSVTSYDLGSEGNLVVGMVIATIKAGLVVTFFMHLLWDKKFHLILFLTAVLFVVLFLSMSVTDRGEYQTNIDLYTNSTSTPAK
jgi:cytochrome c oxidase subunit IV